MDHFRVLFYDLDLIIGLHDLPELLEQALDTLLLHSVKWVILMIKHFLGESIECPSSALQLSKRCHTLVKDEQCRLIEIVNSVFDQGSVFSLALV